MGEHIERELAISEIDDCFPAAPESEFSKGVAVGLAMARLAVCHIPAADVRPVVRGKWIDRDDDYYGWNMWACSACGEEFVLTEGTPDMNEYHFCPNCGADMREPPKGEE